MKTTSFYIEVLSFFLLRIIIYLQTCFIVSEVRAMRGAAMSLRGAASGFVVFLLSVSGTVYLHLYCRYTVTYSEQPEVSFREEESIHSQVAMFIFDP